MINYFVLHFDSKPIIDALTDEEAGKMLKAFFDYTVDGKEPNLDRTLSLLFMSFKHQFERDIESYHKKVERLRENGKKGGAPKGNQNAKKENNQMVEKTTKNNQMVEKTTKTSQEKEEKKEKEKEKYNSSNEEGKYTHVRACETPTLSQVKDVCKAYGFDEQLGEKFYLHYQANGWVQGTGVAIRDWVAQLNKWVADQNKFDKTATNGKPAKYKEREYSDSEFEALFEKDLKSIEL